MFRFGRMWKAQADPSNVPKSPAASRSSGNTVIGMASRLATRSSHGTMAG